MELKGGTLFYHEVAGDARVGQELKISLAGLADGGDAVEIVGNELVLRHAYKTMFLSLPDGVAAPALEAWRAAVVAAKRALDEAASDDDARRPGAMPSLTVTLRSARGVDDWPAQATQGVFVVARSVRANGSTAASCGGDRGNDEKSLPTRLVGRRRPGRSRASRRRRTTSTLGARRSSSSCPGTRPSQASASSSGRATRRATRV